MFDPVVYEKHWSYDVFCHTGLMKYVELFAGIGGFGLALNKLGHECVYANEWDKYASSIYRKQLGEVDTRDIATVPTSDIPDHDLLVGGFPCQTFSVAGKRAGFNDTRGTMFFQIARILKDKRPRYFLLENVKGLLTHESGKTFQTILGVLADIGYEHQWMVLNSKDFGVPQNRERVFIIGNIRGLRRPEIFPIGEDGKMAAGEVNRLQDTQTAVALRDTDYKGTHNMVQIVGGSQGYRVYDPKGISSTLASQAGGLGAKTGLYAIRDLTTGDVAPTLRSGGSGGVFSQRILINAKIRRLTPIECERLQGFPDDWTNNLSDTQRYKCLGNAVTVNVVYEIAKRLPLQASQTPEEKQGCFLVP